QDPLGYAGPLGLAVKREAGFVRRTTGEPVEQVIAKMSKSLRNVVNPDDVVKEYGVDTFRVYEMFMGPLGESKPWNPRDVAGSRRFLDRVWRLFVDGGGGAPGRPGVRAGGGGRAGPAG